MSDICNRQTDRQTQRRGVPDGTYHTVRSSKVTEFVTHWYQRRLKLSIVSSQLKFTTVTQRADDRRLDDKQVYTLTDHWTNTDHTHRL